MSDKMLYGEPDAEQLWTDLDGAVESWFDSCNLEPGDPRLPFTITLYEYSTLPPGDSGDGKVMHAQDIAHFVAESFGENAGFESLGEQYMAAASRPEVVSAFDVARDALIAHQTSLVADDSVRKITVVFSAVDEHLTPTWTLGEWEAL